MSPIIREHHLPGQRGYDGYQPSEEWPDDCVVQWGARGVVLCENPYTTAFFEAFPENPATFIRGEGATVADAEAQALAQWKRIKACAGHRFERRRYRNGGGVCADCDLFMSGVFDLLPEEPHKEDCACGGCQLRVLLAHIADKEPTHA